MPTTRVIDLSHHNVIPESLQAAKDAGVWAVIHKLTENVGFTDDKVESRCFLARQAGLLWGVYHFIRPGNIRQQAEFFVEQAKALGVADDATLYVLDHEDAGVSLDDALEFLRAVEELSGHRPAIYSGHVLKDQLGGEPEEEISQYRLWLAQYTSGEPDLPPGFDAYWLWQFTDDGSVPGIDPPVDCNAYDYTEADLRDEWSGNGAAPGPEPAPEPEAEPTVEIDITVKGMPAEAVHVTITEADNE